MNLNEARDLARELWGPLFNCDAVDAKPMDVDWGEAFDARAEIVYPAFTVEGDGSALLDWIEERDSDDADDFRRRLAGLDDDDAAELEELDSLALIGHGLNRRQRARQVELKRERDNDREELDDIAEEIEERARELAQDEPGEWEPMMNYAYPLPGFREDPEDAQARLEGLPVVVVLLDDEVVLALSGGGMNLSWEICEAYARLGYRPPLQFCELPRMAGRGESDRDRALMALCVESGEVAKMWASNVVERMSERFEADQ